MVTNNSKYQSWEVADETVLQEAHLSATKFYGNYQDGMEMYAPVEQVEKYFNTHSSWFGRCAEPMKVSRIGENSYALAVGKFGAFGYDVEPKIGLELLKPEDNEFQIRTIPVPDYQSPGYEVDYKSSTRLIGDLDGVTRVEWELDLVVELQFPRFIQRLPYSLIQSTGDRILNQIVRKVSHRLTHKVQKDFHQSLNIPFSQKKHK
ncbi:MULTISPECIES: DUF1997 domain-containing protein [Nostocales]|jgi:hypothetical protein|uniref:DUF1997 domain-containing protein n=1 Tax=Dolichospermum flos-aquae UHCC 0037 TaxID=2590026 RepID=A0ACC7S548_DOLFA|nr:MULTISPECIES: DUF1997 domain-containing protein [Nostocales]MCX5982050.1 DUF1997 domain-containing protein [Nostocales cyanobacterium LacPavin_0920_SED1_MAG_38_18]ALB39285.1 hypothetical protein AA650_01335 [Anabaena sp. WA102]MBO1066876.1 DUF1997 domain-containing protein [Anabaena sp. 54]MTJ42617.1 DUF1997 domain-containing protein [Dolichospermum flos-aquae UHCC 0037]OBQ22496.1 MAG: hypothetical protein AN486_02345 [Anabaena sp. AL93]